MSGARAALRERDFRLFWLSLLAEGIALSMATVAVGWQVYAIRGNPLDLGLVGLAEFLPLPLLALPAGQLADRLPRRALLATSRLLDTAILLALLGVTLSGAERLWPFLALAFGTGVASALGAPAGRALTPSLVPEHLLAAAFAVRSVGFQLAVVVGPAVGGLLFALRPELVYATGALLTLVALGCLLRLGAGRTPAGTGAPTLDSVLAGVRLIRRTRVLLGAISLDLFAVLFGGAVVLLPAFAKDVLHVGPTGLGVLRSAPAAGALVAGLLLARRPIVRRVGPILFTVVALFGVSIVVFGLSHAMWLSVFALAVAGGADMVSVVLRQTDHPVRHAGRAARQGHRRRDGLHQCVERAGRVRVGSRGRVDRARPCRCRSAASPPLRSRRSGPSSSASSPGSTGSTSCGLSNCAGRGRGTRIRQASTAARV